MGRDTSFGYAHPVGESERGTSRAKAVSPLLQDNQDAHPQRLLSSTAYSSLESEVAASRICLRECPRVPLVTRIPG